MIKNYSLESALGEALFNVIIQDRQIFGKEIWIAICGLLNEAKAKENADIRRPNCINNDLHLLKIGDDY
jgi:hypothetical protein